ncbi:MULTISPECIES: thiamine phosphate synthase [Paenibacillus]|uniref:thiamine phosphate synthase n=1 Tax=Paenibacillus TaxID=44249 RepID=UPI0022B85BE2|nr:thiamine phosphate synthase [Paenibacillus caseinilyticus]MCZ8520254.1 thiamine phosphate synthase [Paenibacillus caseinilyticus]
MYQSTLNETLAVYLVTGTEGYGGRSAAEIVREALSGGVTLVQLREKTAPLRDVLPAGREIRSLCRSAGVPFVVNDRVDLALLLEADGVHVGQDDLPGGEARKLLGPEAILGISAGTMEEAEWAVSQGADYLGVGPVYATASKGDAGEAIGTELIRRIRARWPRLPLVGIGGIHKGNAAPVFEAGAQGVAVISAITRQTDPREAARGLFEAARGE